jgi:Cytochrome P450
MTLNSRTLRVDVSSSLRICAASSIAKTRSPSDSVLNEFHMTLSIPIADSVSTNTGVCLFILALLSAVLYFFLIQPLFFASLSHIPGPVLCKLSHYYLTYYDMKLQRNDKIKEWHKLYGSVICIGPGEVSFSSPSLMREIYGTSGKYTKSDFFDHFMVYGERSLFSLGPYWDHRHKRNLIASFYHKTSIHKPVVQDGVRDRVHAFIGSIENAMTKSRSLNIYPMLNCYAFDNITRLIYSERHCSHTIEMDCKERQILLGLKQTQLWGPLKFNFPWIYHWKLSPYILPATFRQSLTADDDLGEWNLKRLSAALADPDLEKDYTLLHRMVTVKDKNGIPLTQRYIAAELYDNVLAAQETTAVALTYLVYYLSRRPVWQARIHDEVSKLPLNEKGYPAVRDIDALLLLGAFMREVLRMSPGSGGRQQRMVPTGGKDYGGSYIPEGVSTAHVTLL